MFFFFFFFSWWKLLIAEFDVFLESSKAAAIFCNLFVVGLCFLKFLVASSEPEKEMAK